jgi:ParB family chromosome partitioning protein
MPNDKPIKESHTAGKRKTGLGRGLSALIPDIDMEETSPSDYFQCDIIQIRPNRYQPRVRFAPEELEELTASIREQGIIQPLVVRRDGIGYELVAGERRLRAARMAGLTSVPVIVREISDSRLLEVSIIENIQRENLNPIEESDAYHRLMTEFRLTQEEIAERVGKSRPAVANFLRLQGLPEPIRKSVLENQLSMGHARALLGADTSARQMAAWREILRKGLSVRQAETLIRRMKEDAARKPDSATDAASIQLERIAGELSRDFGTRVTIRQKGPRGRVEIEFYSPDDLNRLIDLLRRPSSSDGGGSDFQW